MFFVGTAGWSIPSFLKETFLPASSHLHGYSQKLNCVEINSSFYRNHKWQTYVKWADTVPEDFRFSVKLAKELTHIQKLNVTTDELKVVLEGPLALDEKLGAVLIQLAPKHAFDPKIALPFFSKLRSLYFGPIAFEPRHLSWISPSADFLFSEFGLSLVSADPQVLRDPQQSHKSSGGFRYTRLHGFPLIYKSRYSLDALKAYACEFMSQDQDQWCIFDNTTFGYATENALETKQILLDSQAPL